MPSLQNISNLIERKQYMQTITGSNAYLLSGELATLLTGRYIETSILPLQFVEYYDFIASKSPNISKIDTLGNYVVEGGIPEYYKQKNISQKQADNFVTSVLNTIVEKDIFERLNVRDNMVYLELLRRHRDVYVGKVNNLEVDFVVIRTAICRKWILTVQRCFVIS